MFKIIAHRGDQQLGTENGALALSGILGEDLHDTPAFNCPVEIDVRCSGDGTVYLMHDESVRRTTDFDEVFAGGVDRLDEMNFHEIQRLSLKKGGPIPRLYEILHCWTGGEVYIHVKDFRSIHPVTELLASMDPDPRFFVVSDEPVLFAALQSLLPGRCPWWYPNLGPVREGPSRGCGMVLLDWKIDGRRFVRKIRSETKMKVYVHNADDTSAWHGLYEEEVHGVLTGYPVQLARWLKKRTKVEPD